VLTTPALVFVPDVFKFFQDLLSWFGLPKFGILFLAAKTFLLVFLSFWALSLPASFAPGPFNTLVLMGWQR
jgi:hypothetical protein